MKSIVSITTMILFTSAAFSQELKEAAVPMAVRESCKQKFPGAKKIEWKLKADKNYEAEFSQHGAEQAVKFGPDGKWLETESEIKEAAVPSAVKNAVAKDFPGYKTIELQSVELPGATSLIYEIHVKKIKETVKLQYSKDGVQLNKSVKSSK